MPEYDPYSRAQREDPHPLYRELRRSCPVYHNERDGLLGAVPLRATFSEASRDWRTFTSTSGSFLEDELEAMREFMPPEGKFQDMDPPRSAELRRLVRDPFSARRGLAKGALDSGDRHRAHRGVRRSRACGPGHRVRRTASGQGHLRHARHPAFRTKRTCRSGAMPCSSDMTDGPRPSSVRSRLHRSGLFHFDGRGTSCRATRRPHERISLVRRSMACPLTDNEIIGMALLLYAAGNETTSMLIGNALWLLDQHPEERERLRAAPAAIPGGARGDAPLRGAGFTAGEVDDARCRIQRSHDSEG